MGSGPALHPAGPPFPWRSTLGVGDGSNLRREGASIYEPGAFLLGSPAVVDHAWEARLMMADTG